MDRQVFAIGMLIFAGCALSRVGAQPGPPPDHQRLVCESIWQTADQVCEATAPPWPDDSVFPLIGKPDIEQLRRSAADSESCPGAADVVPRIAACTERMEGQLEEFETAKQARMAQSAAQAEAVRSDAQYSDVIVVGYWENQAEYAAASAAAEPPANLREVESQYRRQRDRIAGVLERLKIGDPEATWHQLW